jgi:hypothetical protein
MPCTVCRHPRIAEIDADLLDPVRSGYARIAGAYSLRKDAVRRHKLNGHVAGSRPAAVARVVAGTGPSRAEPRGSGDGAPISAVESLSASLRDLEAVDTSVLAPRELTVHVDLKRKVAVDLAKYQVAVDREGPAVRELRALEGMVLAGDEALERFPEARRAVAAAVAEWKARRSG